MKLSHVILFVLCLVLVVGVANAKFTKDSLLVISKVNAVNAPAISSKFVIEPVWNLVDATWMEFGNEPLNIGWSSIAGWAKFLYDSKSLYGLYYVQDDYIDSTSTIDWQMDGIEMFIDAKNTHNSDAYSASNAFQLNLRPAQRLRQDSVKTAYRRGLDYQWIKDTLSIKSGGPIGYYVKFKMSLDSLGLTTPVAVGKKVSFQCQLDDNDGAGRIGTPNLFYSPANADWQNTLQWGNAVFSDEIGYDAATPTKLQFILTKTTTAPVIDGNLDAVYNGANQTTLNYAQPGSVPTAVTTVTDADYRFYGLYDDKNIYGFFTVYDDYIDTTSSVDWQMDGVEMFIDAKNTHDSNPYTSSNAFQLNLRPRQKIDSVQKAYNRGLAYKWKLLPGVPNDDRFHTRGGYTLEYKMSLDSLGFKTPVALGAGFSFQLQIDDNDGAGRAHTANWWYSPANADWQNTLQWGNARFGPAITTGVSENSGQTIRGFELAQNYPNPFNPSTEISFTLVKSEKVKLAVYNLLGKEVAVLVNGTRNAGSQTVTFDAKNLSTGVYFYKLETGSTVLSKKMLLLK